MSKSKATAFLVFAVLIHAVLFGAGYLFLGLPATLLLSFVWACGWIIYCSAKEAPLLVEEEEGGLSYAGEAPVLPMALAGGPWCWLLCPACLFPVSYNKTRQPGLAWNMTAGLLRAFCRSLLKIMGFLHDYCAELAQAAPAAGKADSSAAFDVDFEAKAENDEEVEETDAADGSDADNADDAYDSGTAGDAKNSTGNDGGKS